MQIRAHRAETGWKYQTGRDISRHDRKHCIFQRVSSPRRVAPRRFPASAEEVEGKGD